MSDNRPLLGRILTWTVVGMVALIALKITVRLIGFLIGLAGMAFGVAIFLLFTLGPIILLGWLAVKAWKAFTRHEPAY